MNGAVFGPPRSRRIRTISRMLESTRTLLAYNRWANHRVRGATRPIGSSDYMRPMAGLSHDSLRGTLVHVYGAELVWHRRISDRVSPTTLPSEIDLSTFDELEDAWDRIDAAADEVAAALTEDRLRAIVRYVTTSGVEHETPLWQILHHVVNHGTQFRGEAAVALTALGESPGDLDLISFLRD